jgi:Methyltransferase domain
MGEFHNWCYLQHNQRRQEHLASLGLPLSGRSVIEVGAGIGDHTSFFLDRGCRVVTSDAREENVAILRSRFPSLDVRLLDLDRPPDSFEEEAEIVYCYGTLYHLSRPKEALEFLAARCSSLLLLETCVSVGLDEQVNPVEERRSDPSQSVSGVGCRPTRPWVLAELRKHFPYAYVTRTQPWHPEFPLDWNFEPVAGASRGPCSRHRVSPWRAPLSARSC